MNNRTARFRAAFTLIELLVVVAIIALLISILLPSLSCAREQAKSAKCGVQLRSMGLGLASYVNTNNDWIPGRNTSGVTLLFMLADSRNNPRDVLRDPRSPVQTYDWMSPIMKYDTELGGNRAERFRLLINRWACPTIAGLRVDSLFEDGLNASQDRNDFLQAIKTESFRPVSYLMPVQFQLLGQNEPIRAGTTPNGMPISYQKARPEWEAYAFKYRPQLQRVGMSARKIAVADGTRVLDGPGELDLDPNPQPSFFGAFTSSGAWWAGSTTYGVETGSLNWDNQPVSPSFNRNNGHALQLSYRHTCQRASNATTAQANKGNINALFFDGHVEKLGDKKSRNIEYWYPKGAVVQKPNEGMTKVPQDYVIP